MTPSTKSKLDWEMLRLDAKRQRTRDLVDVFREEFELLHGSEEPPDYARVNAVFLVRRPGAFTRLALALTRQLWNRGTELVRAGRAVFDLGTRLRSWAARRRAARAGLVVNVDARPSAPAKPGAPVEEPKDDPPWEAEIDRIHGLTRGDAANGKPDLRRAALCISGGGIRSATFALGVLQGLARHDLLRRFHFMSTVSGGGYIGSWLSALLTRKRQNPNRPVGRQEIDEVTEVLSEADERREDPEKLEIRHLREYSNYLAPKLGLFSADMFSLVATAIRNVILNWLTLVPIVSASLLFPFVFACLAVACSHASGGGARTALAILGGLTSICLLTALVKLARHLDHAFVRVDEASCPQREFVAWILAPLFGASLLATLFVCVHASAFGAAPSPLAGAIWMASLHFVAASTNARKHGVRQALGRAATAALLGGILGAALGLVLGALVKATWPGDPALAVLAGPLVLPLTYTLALVLRAGVRWYAPESFREWIARAQGWLLIVCIGWTALAAIGLYGHRVWEIFDWAGKLGLAGLTSAVGWGAAVLGSSKHLPAKPGTKPAGWREALTRQILPLTSILFLVLLLSGMCTLALALIDALASSFRWENPDAATLTAALAVMVGLGAVGVFVGFFVGINTFSLHAMYGNRLVRAYLGASRWRRKGSALPSNTDHFTGFSTADDVQMTALVKNRPYHVVNVALNLVSTQRNAWQQRKAESFVITPLHSGSSTTGYRHTGDYMSYEKGRGVSLGRAMTISGAAASPNSGYHSSPIVTFLMTLFNLRLGWWAPNPGHRGFLTEELRLSEPASSAAMLLQEALGLTTDRSSWVHLSDGGHFENLALYEMVRRRCHFIVAVDAGCDPDREFEDLGGAIRKVRIDFGIPIEMSGVNVGVNTGDGQTRCAIGRIQYSAVDKVRRRLDGREVEEPAPDGFLLYVKPSVFDADPVDVRNYREANPEFPHESTGDQFFSESQFESYRALGFRTIQDVFSMAHAQSPKSLLDAFRAAQVFVNSRGSRGAFTIE